MKSAFLGLALAISIAASGSVSANQSGEQKKAVDPASIKEHVLSKDYKAPDGIAFKYSNFVSENVRLTAQWMYASENEGKKLPTVVMAHGWGGTADDFRQDAIDLARAGYLVMMFDYRGWGESDGRVILTSPKPADEAPDHTFTTKVKELREYVDPWEQVEDWFNAISYVVAQPMVDKDRIGIRGSSFSGGHVIYVAANDDRVKAVVTQVGAQDARQEGATKKLLNGMATALATGKAQYPAPRAKLYGDLTGAPIGNKVQRFAPLLHADRVTQPTLFVLAENEELFPNKGNGIAACERVSGPRKMVMVPKITHYGIYNEERDLAIKSAIDWFDQYLKAPGSSTRVPVDTKTAARGDCNAPFVRPQGVAEPQ